MNKYATLKGDITSLKSQAIRINATVKKWIMMSTPNHSHRNFISIISFKQGQTL